MTYDAIVDKYLSEAHRAHPGTGCPLAALAEDIARSNKRTRSVASNYICENIELLAKTLHESSQGDEGTARSRAILSYSALVGTITMAGAVSDDKFSREILKTGAQPLRNPATSVARHHRP